MPVFAGRRQPWPVTKVLGVLRVPMAPTLVIEVLESRPDGAHTGTISNAANTCKTGIRGNAGFRGGPPRTWCPDSTDAARSLDLRARGTHALLTMSLMLALEMPALEGWRCYTVASAPPSFTQGARLNPRQSRSHGTNASIRGCGSDAPTAGESPPEEAEGPAFSPPLMPLLVVLGVLVLERNP